MHIRRSRTALSTVPLLPVVALLCAVLAGCSAADDPNGTSTAAVTLLILGVVGMMIVLVWMASNRSRRPPGS